MRVLFASFAQRTPFFNSVPLAWALRTAGHEVRVAGAPELVDAITGAGLTAVPVGSEETVVQKTVRAMEEGELITPQQWVAEGSRMPDLGENREEELTWEFLTWLYRRMRVPKEKILNDSLFDELVDFCYWWKPDLVISDPITYSGRLAAAVTGAAHARLLFSQDVYGRMREHYLRAKAQQPPEKREDALEEWLGEWAEKYGSAFSEEMTNGQFTIEQLPASLRLETDIDYVSMRYVPYNGTAVVPKWLRRDPQAPRVLMTFGVSMNDWSVLEVITVEQMQEILDSLSDLDIELVITLPANFSEKLTRIPETTRIVEFVPVHAILPSCSAVIHHGGAGAFNGSVLHGIPQLMVGSMAPDVTTKSAYFEEHRTGLSIESAEDVTGPRIRESLVRLLEDPSYRAGAERVRDEARAQPAPNEVVPELERLTAKYRARNRGRATAPSAAKTDS
ncbi:activator-dependent family glycosyltransferase [Streptomyces sp. NPDC087844]|uniref:activator-dependent family glycosyltransferase n=1 Tax=Streptomyces sp. NPDC087844 TaxID=3365805 RepID=UPI0038173ED5